MDYMPQSIRIASQEDVLLDFLISQTAGEVFTSKADMKAAVGEKLFSVLHRKGIANRDAFVDKMTNSLLIATQSDDVKVDRLAKLLDSVTLGNKAAPARIVLVSNVDGERRLHVRVPVIPTGNDGQMDNLGHLLKFAMSLLGMKKDQVKILPDPELGAECLIPAPIMQKMTALVASSSTSKGLFAGEVATIRDVLKANLVETLGAIRILRAHAGILRKKPAVRMKDGTVNHPKVITLEDLKEQFNVMFGLKSSNIPTYTRNYLLQALSEIVKETNTGFPGGFIHSLKERNRCQNSEGVLTLMGYVPKATSAFKVQSVLMSKIDTKDNKDVGIKPMTFEKEGETDCLTYQEFRAGVCLLLPMIDPNSGKALKEQISVNPFSQKRAKTLETFNTFSESIDALNLAHSVKVAVSSKTNKTAKPEHFRVAKATLVNKFSQPVFVDANHKTYGSFKDLPDNVRKFFGKLFHKNVESKKRTAANIAEDADMGESSEVEESTSSSPDKGKKKAKASG
jgi:hypothetical protein